jgi:serine/threonine-protein kinase
MASRADDPPQASALPSGEATVMLPGDEVPEVAPLIRVLAPPPVGVEPEPAAVTLGTPIDAMRAEEIERTRLFIRMGWLLSLVAIATVLVVDAPLVMSIVFVAGLVIGMVVSYGYHRAFAEPRNYTDRALMTLAAICVVNGHIAVLFYGAYTAAVLMIVIGIHFVARTEAERVARWIFACAMVAYAAISLAIITGLVVDPGVFASARPVSPAALATGTCFVLATFWLAYYTARQFRLASLAAIGDLQRATRLASHREALMDELRGDLARALHRGPGRYTGQIVGDYRLGAVLGLGATGEVYEASALATGEPAAVKLLRRELVADPAQRERFARELRAGRALASPHVVRVLGGDPDAPVPFLAMERLRGHTLAERFRTTPRLTGAALVELCRQVGRAVDLAAAAGIVHRDLKPQNVFCTDDGVWKVLDFGVAWLADEPALATEGSVVGTPHYMAPEQAQGQRSDTRADLYALGAIAYRCATGWPPLDADDPAALLYAIVHRMPARPSELADLPSDFDRFCAVALAKAPADRFASGAALAVALAAALRGELDDGLRDRADAAIRATAWEPA